MMASLLKVILIVMFLDLANSLKSDNLPYEVNTTQNNASIIDLLLDDLHEHARNLTQKTNDENLNLNNSNRISPYDEINFIESPKPSDVLSTNPQLEATYISADIAQAARENLQLHEFFKNVKTKFDFLFKKLQIGENKLAAMNKTIGEFEYNAKSSLDTVENDTEKRFNDVQKNLSDLDSKQKGISGKISENLSQVSKSTGGLQSVIGGIEAVINNATNMFSIMTNVFKAVKLPEKPKCNETKST